MNKFILVILLASLIFAIYKCYTIYNIEKFEGVSSDQSNDIKKYITSFLEDNKNVMSQNVNDILAAFKTSQNENLEQRLIKFKELINQNDQFDKSIYDDLYFDLRMTDKVEVRNKLIASYKMLSDFVKNKEINVSPTVNLKLTDENKNTLTKLLKEFSKNGKYD